jgi:hypothetical protein
MTTWNETKCDSCGALIARVGHINTSNLKSRTVRLSLYREGSMYSPQNFDFHICKDCYSKYKVLQKDVGKIEDYRINAYALLNDLLIEMGVQFKE